MDEMREIKFKAKRLDNGEWVFGSVMEFNDRFYVNKWSYGPDFHELSEDDFFEVQPETVCQFISLKDYLGHDVWEGDILCADDNSAQVVITFTGGQFVGKNMDENAAVQETQNRNWRNWIVVGNIHDKTPPQ